MKQHDDNKERSKQIAYYIDEAVVFVITILAVTFSSALKTIIKQGNFDIHTLALSISKVIASVIITVLIYGAFNQSFKYNDKNKPSIFKRIYTHAIMGIGWRSIVGDVLDN